ncbi:Alkaline phosphatase synthesis transcriptional regulatory protein PhoP [Thermoflexales bacterium]|nr:Alkaline phosphatase synthesis transcriptional regulatory protein PhoP [Thermoflexales bacterium]
MNESERTWQILLVDDEEAITANLAPFLERAGFRVEIASDGAQALDRVQQASPDLIVMDVLMPHLDGREALRQLRRSNNWLPVILLTQVGESIERAMALEEGADDYLNKPFDPYELIARMRAVLRRARPGRPPLTTASRLICGEVSFDRRTHRVYLAAQEITLTPKAVALLEYLLTHPDELLTRERLLEAVWGWDYPAGTRTVDTRIAELRRALSDDVNDPRYIETAPGEGYRFVGKVEGA